MLSMLSTPRSGGTVRHDVTDRVDWDAAEPGPIVAEMVNRIRLGSAVLTLTDDDTARNANLVSLIGAQLSADGMRVERVGRGGHDSLSLQAMAAQVLGKPEDMVRPQDLVDLQARLTRHDDAGKPAVLIVNDASCLQADAMDYLSKLSSTARADAPRILFVGFPAFAEGVAVSSESGRKEHAIADMMFGVDGAEDGRESVVMLSPRRANRSVVPIAQPPADADGDAAAVPPLPTRTEHLKRIFGSVFAVGLIFFGIMALATSYRRDNTERAAAPAGLSITIPPLATNGAALNRDGFAQPDGSALPSLRVDPIASLESDGTMPPRGQEVAVPVAPATPVDTPRPATEASAAPAPPPAAVRLAPVAHTPPVQAPPSPATLAEINALLTRGDSTLAIGDIAAARLFYERAASLGSAHAATMMGKTYDPQFLATMRVNGVAPDGSLAITWYRRGAALGDAEATDRVDQLEATATAH